MLQFSEMKIRRVTCRSATTKTLTIAIEPSQNHHFFGSQLQDVMVRKSLKHITSYCIQRESLVYGQLNNENFEDEITGIC